ncbi:MAG: hypothetical protein HY507_01320 [Candidatus Zambryskibacteria bacterium]|nr:hypothetical protein [Candidatus Zambryskibacteria bacterium]
MLYFLHGTDTHKARKKLHELLDLAEKKRPGAEIFKLTTENWSEGQFDELIIARGLFESKYTVILDNLFERKDIKDFILNRLKRLADSEQIFLQLEGKLDVPTLKKIEKSAKQVQEFKKPESVKNRAFNIFSITDSLVKKDKKRLWISYIDLLSKGAGAEEMHGILFWKVKTMILNGVRTYSLEELRSMSSQLVNMTHRVRQGEGELEIMLEKWIFES